MDIVLGVSMTPSAVRMALVEGEGADGVTLDQDAFDVLSGVSAATSDAPEQVVAAILGTRESAAEGGHHLAAVGVAWTDHAAAARLRQALRAQRIDDVVLVSELHAASALAQALGRATGCERTALLFAERDTATLAVVRTSDGSVLQVTSRSLHDVDTLTDLPDVVARLETGNQPPQTLFMLGSGVDIAALKEHVVARTALPVHAPDDGDLALARGAALAAANTPRYEAATVGLLSADDTAAGPTQMAAAGYMAPLGYSAVPDDDLDDLDDLRDVDPEPEPDDEPADRRPFLLISSAVSTLFVVGVVALAMALAVAIRPGVEQRPVPGESAVVSNSQPSAQQQAQPEPPGAAPETIQAPIPVVQEAPRTVFVAPRQAAPAPPPAAPALAPAPEAAPAPAAPAPVPAAPAPVPAPAPAAAPVPVVVPVPVIPPVLPRIFQIPARSNPIPQYPRTYPTYPSAPPSSTPTPTAPSTQATQAVPTTQSAPATAYPTYTAPVTTQAPSSGSSSSGGDSDAGESGGRSKGSQTIWPPLWPFGS